MVVMGAVVVVYTCGLPLLMVVIDKTSGSTFLRLFCIFFFKQKTAYELRISDWSSDVCSSDLCDIFASPDRKGFSHSVRPSRMMRLTPSTCAGNSPTSSSGPSAAGRSFEWASHR